MADANVKTNSTLKRLMSGSQGARLFRGSPILRDAPSDTAKRASAPSNILPFDSSIPLDQRDAAISSDPLTRGRARNTVELLSQKIPFSKLRDKVLANFDAKYGTNPK